MKATVVAKTFFLLKAYCSACIAQAFHYLLFLIADVFCIKADSFALLQLWLEELQDEVH